METTRDQYAVPTQLGRIVYWSLLGCFVALYFTVEPAIENLSPSLNEDASLAELRAAANWQDQLFVYICLLSVFIFGCLQCCSLGGDINLTPRRNFRLMVQLFLSKPEFGQVPMHVGWQSFIM